MYKIIYGNILYTSHRGNCLTAYMYMYIMGKCTFINLHKSPEIELNGVIWQGKKELGIPLTEDVEIQLKG